MPTQHTQAVWFLIVANFIDKSFDVLNPNNETDTLLPLINAACYNFKILFLESFPHCPFLNIRDFNIRHIEVPKVDSRYAMVHLLFFEPTLFLHVSTIISLFLYYQA